MQCRVRMSLLEWACEMRALSGGAEGRSTEAAPKRFLCCYVCRHVAMGSCPYCLAWVCDFHGNTCSACGEAWLCPLCLPRHGCRSEQRTSVVRSGDEVAAVPVKSLEDYRCVGCGEYRIECWCWACLGPVCIRCYELCLPGCGNFLCRGCFRAAVPHIGCRWGEDFTASLSPSLGRCGASSLSESRLAGSSGSAVSPIGFTLGIRVCGSGSCAEGDDVVSSSALAVRGIEILDGLAAEGLSLIHI